MATIDVAGRRRRRRRRRLVDALKRPWKMLWATTTIEIAYQLASNLRQWEPTRPPSLCDTCVCLIPTVQASVCVRVWECMQISRNINSFNDIFNLPRIELFAIGCQCARIVHGQWISILCFLIANLRCEDDIDFQIFALYTAEGHQEAGENKNWLQHGCKKEKRKLNINSNFIESSLKRV